MYLIVYNVTIQNLHLLTTTFKKQQALSSLGKERHELIFFSRGATGP